MIYKSKLIINKSDIYLFFLEQFIFLENFKFNVTSMHC